MKPINRPIFITFTILFLILAGISFVAAWDADEGDPSSDPFWVLFRMLFDVFRFPTHTLLWPLMKLCPPAFDALVFFGGLLVNCMIYALAIERMAAIRGMIFRPRRIS